MVTVAVAGITPAMVALAREEPPELAPAIVAVPLVAFGLILLLGDRMPHRGLFPGTLAAAGSLLLSVAVAVDLFTGGGPYHVSLYTFAGAAGETATAPTLAFGLTIDPLSVLAVVLVSALSLVVHVFSFGFMNAQGESNLRRYYAGLSLFTFAMLGFVLSNSLLLLFVFFEILGLCSYLLIGFWTREHTAARAASKAFLVTRVGDYLLLVGVVATAGTFGTTAVAGDASVVTAAESALAPGQTGEMTTYLGLGEHAWVTVLALLLLGGALGKSAQFPLQTWLPDAMAGPTPVSALIHAATMVAAGVYLIARVYGLFVLSPAVLAAMAVIGAVTALGAVTVALFKHDLKQVLAYSTISQYGYMLLALGAGGYTAAVFHLTTHAVFKSLLFLGAGAVVVATGHTLDLRKLGGLGDSLRITFGTFSVAALALAGIVPFAGFWSKDKALLTALERGLAGEPVVVLAYGVGLVGVVITAANAARMVLLVFCGSPRSAAAQDPAPVGRSMQIALLALAPLTVLAGALYPAVLEGSLGEQALLLERWLDGATIAADYNLTASTYERVLAAEYGTGFGHVQVSALVASGAVLVLKTTGLIVGWWYYRRVELGRTRLLGDSSRLRRLLKNGCYHDALQHRAVTRGVLPAARALDRLDRGVVDGLVNAAGAGSLAVGRRVRRLQSGPVSASVRLLTVALTLLVLGLGVTGGWLP